MSKHTKTTVLVIGGGPAGSTAASFLARANVEVTLVERDVFPRYHVGESLLPACLEVLDLIGARGIIENAGFQRKPGAYLDWNGEQWVLDFGELSGQYKYSFQVPRAEFDHLLLQHARAQGVLVHEGTDVRGIVFERQRPVAAVCFNRTDGTEFRIDFDYLVDASGRSGLMATRYLRNRRFHHAFQNVAVWGYWEGCVPQPEVKPGAIAVGSIPEGWLWGIPFSNGQTSIGAVIQKDALQALRKTHSLSEIYARTVAGSPLLKNMTTHATLASELRVEQDYSYNSEKFAGPGYFLAGDSACFLDPLLSTGVHLAMYSSMLSAAGIASLLRGEVSEEEAVSWYEQSYRSTYLRYLLFVSAFYESIGKLGYFRTAVTMSRFDEDPGDLKRAFLNLVSGLEDFAVAEQTTAHLMGEMKRRVRENLEIRNDKTPLEDRMDRDNARNSDRFMDAIEGLTCLSPDNAVGGLYVRVRPSLGLVRVGLEAVGLERVGLERVGLERVIQTEFLLDPELLPPQRTSCSLE